MVPASPREGRAPADPDPWSPTQLRVDRAGSRGPPKGRTGGARPFHDRRDVGPVLPCCAEPAAWGREGGGSGAVRL